MDEDWYERTLEGQITTRFRNERNGRRGERFPEGTEPDDDFGDDPELVPLDPWQLA